MRHPTSELLALRALFPGADLYFTYGQTELGPRVSTLHVDAGTLSPGDPVPLGVPLRCEGYIAEHSGRRFKLKGQVLAGTTRTASAEGIFVDVSGDRFATVMAGVPQ